MASQPSAGSRVPRLPRVQGDRIVAAHTRNGWGVARRRGSHVVPRYPPPPSRPERRIVVPVHSGRTVKTGTLAAIPHDAGVTPEEFSTWL